jgi:hypothetical protein
MCFLKVMSFTQPHKVLKGCCATLGEGHDVIYLESDTHVACWYLADTIALLNGCSQWCRNCPAHMRNRLDIYSIDNKKF